jgi:phospholipid/cholesterol/gamma-HCH transport system permease protein
MNLRPISALGEYVVFVGKAFQALPRLSRRRNELLIQLQQITVGSILLITLTAAFTGMVTALQAVYQSKGYMPINLLSVLIGKSTMIELAPVLTALVMTGKVGASMAAEIGTMKVSEQLDALESMSIKASNFLYMPRILAGMIGFPIITIYANLISIISAWYFAWMKYGIHYHTFFVNMRSYFSPSDLWGGLIKSLVFGYIITSLACFFGSKSQGGAEGVGISTTQTVIYSSVFILIMDFMVAWVLFGGF